MRLSLRSVNTVVNLCLTSGLQTSAMYHLESRMAALRNLCFLPPRSTIGTMALGRQDYKIEITVRSVADG